MLHNYVDSLYFPQRTDDDVSVHDQIIWNLHINGIDELLLFLGSNQTEVLVVREMQRVAFVEGCIAQNLYIWVLNWLAFISQLVEAAERFVICQTLFQDFFYSMQSQWCMHVLEIMFLMMREQVRMCVRECVM